MATIDQLRAEISKNRDIYGYLRFLSDNELVGPDGAEALAASLVDSQVRHLNLKHNQLYCAGVAAFASMFQLANTARVQV